MLERYECTIISCNFGERIIHTMIPRLNGYYIVYLIPIYVPSRISSSPITRCHVTFRNERLRPRISSISPYRGDSWETQRNVSRNKELLSTPTRSFEPRFKSQFNSLIQPRWIISFIHLEMYVALLSWVQINFPRSTMRSMRLTVTFYRFEKPFRERGKKSVFWNTRTSSFIHFEHPDIRYSDFATWLMQLSGRIIVTHTS